ncbi:Rieske (2Fe-2S) protein [Streptomyces prunicolor]|uniref:Rieske (2Fe-2S) protein n=1 Tax=Streptomyces prunicolor TaxID=67348 RepID=A0ABU4FE54_9ACTN|nr:Rieske (2Fe-2S) protein [Streptomyces prunicolor]MDV7218879.1 Rieske (2Fe-2S) protein [Streptomyces prunicolor]
MTTTESDREVQPRQLERLRGRPVRKEGENGLFSEGWYPVCLSSEIPEGGIHGADFLDGRVVIFRGEDGKVRVTSAYCMHLGADLTVGTRTPNGLQCLFHGWEYDGNGRCVALPSGDPVPPRAQLYSFTAIERYGIVFVYNGEQPLYDLPAFEYPEEELVVKVVAVDHLVPVDPWVIAANTPDLLHITELHKFEMFNNPYEEVAWHPYSVDFTVHARLPTGQDFDIVATIHGTNYFWQTGTLDGRWFGWVVPLGIPKAGSSRMYPVIAVKPEPGETPEETQAVVDYLFEVEMAIAAEDAPVFAGMHYAPGNLTHGDRILARFLEYVRHFPRALPSADFIN